MVKRRQPHGMTLVEVLVALLVATAALLGSLAMVFSVTTGAGFSRHATEAQALAQSRLEQLQSLKGVTGVVPMNPPDTGPPPPAVPVFVVEAAGQFGAITNPLDATGATNNLATGPNGGGIFNRRVAWQTVQDPYGQRRVISVNVWWNELTPNQNGTIGSPGYHEVTMAGVRLP
jgi:hypothetical protein